MTDAPPPVGPAVPSAAAPAVAPDGDRRVIVSWALYDLANTIYSAIVVTLFLPKYVKDTYGSASPVGRATAVTLLLSGFVSPWLGAMIDRTGKARRGLDVSTWICVLASAALCFLAPLGLWPAMLCFGVSLFAYQAALTFYNALLPAVAPPHRRGWVSGLGTGLGYLGIPIAVTIALFVKNTPLGIPAQKNCSESAVVEGLPPQLRTAPAGSTELGQPPLVDAPLPHGQATLAPSQKDATAPPELAVKRAPRMSSLVK